MANKLNSILTSWKGCRNVLLYGPPATGKTRLISDLFQALSNPPESQRGIVLDPDNTETPFSRPPQEISIPQPTKVVWTTFHQSYSYEDFVLGLRPEISSEGTKLQPWAGVFLDAALELSDSDSEYNSVVIFIDEINRGNAARIFGEFMTFLDFDYREQGRVTLPLPLRQLKYQDGLSERICRAGGKEARISEGFTFPKDIYIVATMNSVDRAAVPIDSALGRRFDRIEMRPDLNVLAQHWDLDVEAIPEPTEENWHTLDPFITAYILLDRINVSIASDLGSEFELGHGLLTSITANRTIDQSIESVDEIDAWNSLAKVWDDILYPQLEDRYSGRPEQLIELLRADTPPSVGEYAWGLRTAKGNSTPARTLASVRVSELDISVIKRSFRWLTR
ncbi:AAA family ATPase [Vibrio coralliilyticus]|uniref:AAA domain-containing protein n=1 Tax=Vibrio coralliilyticus TaxID=190893 RepID=A0AAP7DEH3_9VIBR|nr:AAA family ATPase [Vibrio coralliilyticus]NOI30753.1 AAA domain-containing protein [Vibrio coralliilyticus]NOI49700.1 AAA domain-containing protein [Vibrio coralliilyticus]NOJ23947.1 AAA domain-containing protein [Vibrio coralliilyticus]